MTDKEQIMINGVDVSRCKLLCSDYCSLHTENELSLCPCEDYPNCYFKQLARKTQECDRYRKALEEIGDLLFQVTGVDFPKDDYVTPAYKEIQTYYRNLQKQILDIINKVKGEEE